MLLVSGLNGLFGLVLVGGCAEGAERSHLLSLASQPALTQLGAYSFHVYLLQWLVATHVATWQYFARGSCSATYGKCLSYARATIYSERGSIQSDWWLVLMATAWIAAGRWSSVVEEPWARWLRGADARLEPTAQAALRALAAAVALLLLAGEGVQDLG